MQEKIKVYPYNSKEPLELDILELEKRYEFTFLDSFVEYNFDLKSCKLKEPSHKAPRLSDFYIKETKKIGAGLYANRNFEVGEKLGNYVGEYLKFDGVENTYEYFPYVDYYRMRNDNVIVTPREVGNLTRFIQHSFSTIKKLKEFYGYSFSDKFLDKVALSNSKFVVPEDNRPFVEITKSIKKGDQILVDYGEAYWKKFWWGPCVFDKQGNTLKLDIRSIIRTIKDFV